MAALPTAPPQANQVKPNYVIYRMVIGDERQLKVQETMCSFGC